MESRTYAGQADAGVSQLIVGSIEDYAIFTTDVDGIITSWNPGVGKLLGFRKQEFIGRSSAMIFTPEDRENGAFEQEMSVARHDGKAIDRRWHLRSDGSRFWADGMLITLGGDDPSTSYVKIMRDDTQGKLLEDQLAEANHLKDVFLATLAHELRTPLMAILGWTQVLRDGGDEEMLEMGIGIIEQNAMTQSRLVEDLLDMARIAGAKLGLRKVPVDLRNLVAGAVESIRPLMEEKDIELELDIVDTPTIISGDPERLRQIIGNLLTNSLKFTPERGRVTVALTRTSHIARISVSDTGEGIDEQSRAVIFEPFVQAEEPGRTVGTGLGLGLSIARQLVELHDGTIDVASPGLGHGSTFEVCLPLIGVPMAEQAS